MGLLLYRFLRVYDLLVFSIFMFYMFFIVMLLKMGLLFPRFLCMGGLFCKDLCECNSYFLDLFNVFE